MGIAVSSQRSAVSQKQESREIFAGFRGWKVERGSFGLIDVGDGDDNEPFFVTQQLTVVCERCLDLMLLCHVVHKIDPDAIVDVGAGEPFLEITITLDDQCDVAEILDLR